MSLMDWYHHEALAAFSAVIALLFVPSLSADCMKKEDEEVNPARIMESS